MKKKTVSCECSGSILKKTNKQTTATKNKKKTKNNLLIRAIQCHCGVLTRKVKRPVTVALPYPPPRSIKMKEKQKPDKKKNINKSKSKAKFFMFFQQHYKRTNFSVFDDHIYA